MNRMVAFLICILLSPQAAWADDDAVPKAVVRSDKCIFKFPIRDIDRVWKWGISPMGHGEYQWIVTVKRGDTSYQLGFSHFNPDAVPQSGKLTDLLAAGQSNVWKLAADGTAWSYVEGVHVTCRPASDHLLIIVHDEAWTRDLFGDRPKTVEFETAGTQLNQTQTMVTVVYESDHSDSGG